MPYEVFLKKSAEKKVISSHSWVYANEVEKILGKDHNGSLATVYSHDGKFIGKGYINHLSKILVRIFIRDINETDDKNLFLARIKQADDYRKNLGYDNCYRMVFAEADNLPALIVDKYGDVLSCQFLSLGMEKTKPLIVECLIELFNPKGIYERSDVGVREKEGLDLVKGKLYGDFDTVVPIIENGINMLVDIENGQKTGYFLDQKENRLAIQKYCKDKEVLDCFCNNGGFSFNAAKGGAKSVIAADISQTALDAVNVNAKLNGYENIISCVKGDVFEILREYKNQNKKFDFIILDPPAFAKTADNVSNAMRGYRDINILAMKLVRSGGFLATSSCSRYMTFPLFTKMLTESAISSGRTVRVAEIKTQSPDHPSPIFEEETSYLKFFILNII
ncbi:MAG TPA: class I SAM-dependent rRNA methyltransferase [Clostridia bacterium]|nr:class I SAM-dependent rRNA methyltransferase [Clostridia bacterium]